MYHLKIFLRSLRRGKVYTAINVGGLAIGLAAAILIFLWVQNERSFDGHHPDAGRIYRITNVIDVGTDHPWIWETSPYLLIEHLKTDVPEIESVAATMMFGMIAGMKVGDHVYNVKDLTAYVDRAWFEMFDYRIVEGSLASFGAHPYSVALTETEARKYFGDRQAVGNTVNIDGKNHTVQTVLKDYPSNVSFRRSILISTESLLSDPELREQYNIESWDSYNFAVFVKLRHDADAQQTGEKIRGIIAVNRDDEGAMAFLRPLMDIHFETDLLSSEFIHGDGRAVPIFTILGMLLLITACINYVNLTMARSGMRAKEVGVKKIVGARRSSLFFRFVGESFVLSLISILIALNLMLLFSSPYHSLTGNEISFASPVTWIVCAATLLSVTALNGIYPALMLSAFNPVNSLKGFSFSKVKNSVFRKGLTIFQFTLSAALTVCVLIIFQQMRYMQTKDPGYNREQAVVLDLPYRALNASGSEHIKTTVQSMKHELQSLPELTGVAVSSHNIAHITTSSRGGMDWAGRDEDFNPVMTIINADADYMNLMGLQLVEGRWFESGSSADRENVLLNETALRELKIQEPYTGQRFRMQGREGVIIGVVKDFHFRSMHEPIVPLVVHNFNDYTRMLTVKIHPGSSHQALEAIYEVWQKFFPNDAFEYRFLDDTFNELHKADIRTSRLILVFSALAIIIAALGLFGLTTFTVERRTKEIGIRKVLGASVPSIVHLITREFFILVAIAFAIATPVAWWAMSRWLENFAYRINISVWIFVAGAALTLAIALLAVGIHAIKAATANPLKAIKSE